MNTNKNVMFLTAMLFSAACIQAMEPAEDVSAFEQPTVQNISWSSYAYNFVASYATQAYKLATLDVEHPVAQAYKAKRVTSLCFPMDEETIEEKANNAKKATELASFSKVYNPNLHKRAWACTGASALSTAVFAGSFLLPNDSTTQKIRIASASAAVVSATAATGASYRAKWNVEAAIANPAKEKEEAAAIKMQSLVRGKLARNEVAQMKRKSAPEADLSESTVYVQRADEVFYNTQTQA